MSVNRQFVLASRPSGWPTTDNFRLVEAPLPSIGDGQLLVRNLYLSLDPYMRGRMNDSRSYAAKVELGQVMIGATVGEVIESRHAGFAAGDHVVGSLGWQLYAASDGKGLLKVPTGGLPLTAYLGAVGMPGVTAWFGLGEIGRPRAGETVVVSAAAGAVGGVVGQLARLAGCRAVGIAGGRAKCEYVTGELGFDACVDYKAGHLDDDLRAATPHGVDIYFENVGGDIFDAVARRLNPFARIPLCGLISQYNDVEPRGVRYFASLLVNRVKLKGFIVSDHVDRWGQALAELGAHVAAGRIKYRETIADGLESAPAAFLGLLRGENLGKQLVKLA